MDGDSLSYLVDVLDGSVPSSTGPCALFIGPFGRPPVARIGTRDASARAPSQPSSLGE
jgi:hypothetical protein